MHGAPQEEGGRKEAVIGSGWLISPEKVRLATRKSSQVSPFPEYVDVEITSGGSSPIYVK